MAVRRCRARKFRSPQHPPRRPRICWVRMPWHPDCSSPGIRAAGSASWPPPTSPPTRAGAWAPPPPGPVPRPRRGPRLPHRERHQGRSPPAPVLGTGRRRVRHGLHRPGRHRRPVRPRLVGQIPQRQQPRLVRPRHPAQRLHRSPRRLLGPAEIPLSRRLAVSGAPGQLGEAETRTVLQGPQLLDQVPRLPRQYVRKRPPACHGRPPTARRRPAPGHRPPPHRIVRRRPAPASSPRRRARDAHEGVRRTPARPRTGARAPVPFTGGGRLTGGGGEPLWHRPGAPPRRYAGGAVLARSTSRVDSSVRVLSG